MTANRPQIIGVDEGDRRIVGTTEEKHDGKLSRHHEVKDGILLVAQDQRPVDSAIGQGVGLRAGVGGRLGVQKYVDTHGDRGIAYASHDFRDKRRT